MNIIDRIFSNATKFVSYLFLIGIVLIATFITVRIGYVYGLLFSFFPLLLILLIKISERPFITFIILFITNYYISGVSRYLSGISPGIFMDMITIIVIILMIAQLNKKKLGLRIINAFNPLTFIALIWLTYCFLQLLNPLSTSILGWVINVRGIGVYFLIITMITSILLSKYEDLKKFLVVWAILSITAVLKAFIQKTFGFDFFETKWLNEGGSSTHLISSGIRYFSFFTDAANFGSGIAFSMMIFLISSLHCSSIKYKIFFILTSIICGYGMIISGTRGSLTVPFTALLLFTFLSGKIKNIIFAALFLIVSLYFLKETYIGHSNSYVRRMRSVFNTEDASFVVRRENQKKLAVYLTDKPFGAGIGMSRGEVSSYKANPFFQDLPSDSWYVLIWMETGIVGLVLYILILIYILIYGIFIIIFKLKSPELKGIVTSIVCGLAGVYVASYSIEIMGQFPNSFIIFICMAIIFISPEYDKQIRLKESESSYEELSD